MRCAIVAVRRFIPNAAGKQEGVVEGLGIRSSAPTAGVMLLRAAPVRCRLFFGALDFVVRTLSLSLYEPFGS
jgi:hypothetical protein